MADGKALQDLLSKHKIDWNLNFPAYTLFKTQNKIPVYSIKGNKPGLVYCEWIFENGRVTEKKKLASRMTANQIQEGTNKYDTKKVADFFDFYGCAYSIHADLDFTSISISCLQKHFDTINEFVIHLMSEPAFKEENLSKSKKAYISQLQHQNAEPDFVSYREFTGHIFGPQNVYGYNSSEALFNAITTEDLSSYHTDNYTSDCLTVFYAGEIFDGFDNFWNERLSGIKQKKSTQKIEYIPETTIPIRQHFSMPHCAQVSLKIGRKLWSKTNPDFFGFYVLNAILGDYFGSRLMKNIREDKGLTYDIHSTLDGQLYDGCFYVSAELNANEVDRTIGLVKEEFDILKNELISENELNMVKNYLYGHMLRLLDGSFQSILFLKILMTEYKDILAFKQLIQTIESISPMEIQLLAKKYLNIEEMTIVTAGK